MRERIVRETGKRSAGRMMAIGTFHAVCLDFLKIQGQDFFLAGEAELRELAETGDGRDRGNDEYQGVS